MTASRANAVIALALFAATRVAAGQASVEGRVFDSLSTRAPLADATIVLVERSRYATTDPQGRFRFDSVPAGRYSLGILHPVLDSFDLVLPTVSVEVAAGSSAHVELTIPSAATAYARGCQSRPAQVANKTDLVAYLRVARDCRVLARRADTQPDSGRRATASNNGSAAQLMAPVTVLDTVRSMSLMAVDGFYERRSHGLGTFMTDADIQKHPRQRLAELFESVPGFHLEYGTNGQPMAYMIGIGPGHNPYCIPTFFIDGVPYNLTLQASGGSAGGGGGSGRGGGGAGGGGPGGGRSGGPALSSPFNDLSVMIRPEMITGLEVYETSGVIPAQYDRTSSTGCGSVVIRTR
jgi:uncharacterized membrane protein YgcG